MPYYSLVIKATNTVTQVVDNAELKFSCHENYFWAEGPETYDKEANYEYNTETGKIKLTDYGPKPWKPERVHFYGDPYSQLGMLFDDIHYGRLPGKETSEWYKHVLSVKQQIPKTDI